MGASNADFQGVTYSKLPNENKIIAIHPDKGEIGKLKYSNISNTWDNEPGNVISHIEVHPDFRRMGIATGMFNYANSLGLNIHHDTSRSTSANEWYKKIGGPIAFGLHGYTSYVPTRLERKISAKYIAGPDDEDYWPKD